MPAFWPRPPKEANGLDMAAAAYGLAAADSSKVARGLVEAGAACVADAAVFCLAMSVRALRIPQVSGATVNDPLASCSRTGAPRGLKPAANEPSRVGDSTSTSQG